ncbi:MAG: HAD family phosphatase [Lachnospiraceae bacterium]|nr:HAD family phosphatase [Lachnospiraceae bacterium]
MEMKGVIFDMDGLMLDTEKLYNRFWREAAAEFGYTMTYEHALVIRSMNPVICSATLKQLLGKDFPYEEAKSLRRKLMKEYVKIHGVEKKKGLDELLQYLKENKFKIAVATSSNRSRTEWYLTSVGIWDYFDKIICGDMVPKGKPEPDIYLIAAKQLGLFPSECIALEDAPAGILSAHRAGCHPVFVPDLDEGDITTRETAEYIAESLSEVIDFIKKEG